MSTSQTKKVLIACGGTGGHLFPAQQLAHMLRSDCSIVFAGHKLSDNPFFMQTVQQHPSSAQEKIFSYVEITSHPVQKGFFGKVWKGFWESIRYLIQFSPDVVVGFGSYHTFPILLASVVLRKKIVLFEANAILGKVNRFFSPFAQKIAFQFPTTCLQKHALVPWLPWTEQKIQCSVVQAREFYGLAPDCDTVLVFGGSQGASFLNEQVPEVLSRCSKKVQVIHITGKEGEDKTRALYERYKIICYVTPFEKQMFFAYTAATFAICRSGAGTIAELIRFQVPALLIPYPYATEDHQRKNGEFLSQLGASCCMVQKEAQVEKMVQAMEELYREREQRLFALRALCIEGRGRTQLAELVRGMMR